MVSKQEWYKECDMLEEEKMNSDYLYKLIVSKTPDLDEIVGLIVTEMETRYPTMSVRLKSIFHTVKNSDETSEGNLILKHGLLFFALANEPWVIDILTSRGKIPPERYDLFMRASLVPCSKSLLKGGLTSLGVYVEEVRGEYIIS